MDLSTPVILHQYVGCNNDGETGGLLTKHDLFCDTACIMPRLRIAHRSQLNVNVLVTTSNQSTPVAVSHVLMEDHGGRKIHSQTDSQTGMKRYPKQDLPPTTSAKCMSSKTILHVSIIADRPFNEMTVSGICTSSLHAWF